MTGIRVTRRTSSMTVPVLRTIRRGDRHFVLDLSLRIRITLGSVGAVDAEGLARTVHELVADQATDQTETLALAVARQCAVRSDDVVKTHVDVRARGWNRLDIGGRPRERDMIGPAGEDRLTRVTVADGREHVAAGFDGMLLLTAARTSGPAAGAAGVELQRLSALWTYGWGEIPFETQWQQVRRGLTEAYAERGLLSGGALAEALGQAVIDESPPVRVIRVRLGMVPNGMVHGRVIMRNEAVE